MKGDHKMTYDTTIDVVNVIMGIVSRDDSLRKITEADFDECCAVVQSFVDTECQKRLEAGGKSNAGLDGSQSVTLSHEFVDEVRITMRHARTFITSRQKMNRVGVELYDEILDKLEGVPSAYECPDCKRRYTTAKRDTETVKCTCGAEARLIANASLEPLAGKDG
jgi:hypothetical protein